MTIFKKIFDRHYFSNHYIEAQEAESLLKDIFVVKHAVLFANFSTLVMSLEDELNANISANLPMKTINRINQFIKATGREKINAIIDEEIVKFGKYISKLENFSEWITGYVYIDDLPNSLIFNISLENEITNITALITDDDIVAEKMRWSRASYGREGLLIYS